MEHGVVLAFCHPGEVSGAFTDSLLLSMHRDARNRRYLTGPKSGIITLQTGPRIAEARSQIMESWLTNEDQANAEFLWMLDADMTFEADTLERLVDAAVEVEADVMGGLCFAGGRSARIYPTIYKLDRDDQGPIVEPVMAYPRNALVKVGATGAACMLIRRRIALAMWDAYKQTPDGKPNPYPWFVDSVDGHGRPFGEDIAFCMRVNALGGSVWVDTRIKIGHVKSQVLDEPAFDRARRR